MVRTTGLFLGALLIGWNALPWTAQAQMVCGKRSDMVAGLEKNYSEAPVSIGLASNGSVIEIFASPKQTWTIVMTRPDGQSCVLMAGESWEDLPTQIADIGA